jgi:hypothetical protein
MQSAGTDRDSNEEFGMFLMKTTSKMIFSFVAAGLLVSAFGSQGLAQSSASPSTDSPSTASPEKPLSPAKLKKLCKKTPGDERCVKKDDSMTAPTATPSSTDSTSTTPGVGGGSTSTEPTTTTPPTEPVKPAGDLTTPSKPDSMPATPGGTGTPIKSVP